MSGYALQPDVFSDLDDIRKHIAEDNPEAAERVMTEIFDGVRALVAFPNQAIDAQT
jgi:plasmid stabilization system protein ParE